MSTELRQALDKVARRFRRLRLWRGLALCWLAWSILALLLYLASSRPGYEWLTGQERLVSLAMLAAATGIVCALFASRAARDPRWVARRIEARHPELAAALLAAVEQNVEDPSGQLGYLQTAVIRQALEHGRRSDWNRAVPTRTMGLSQLAHAVALGLLLLAAAALAGQVYTRASDRTKPVPAAQAFDVEVEPGSHRDRARHVAPGRRPFQGDRARAREHGDRRLAPGPDQTGNDAKPGRPDVRRPRRIG